MRCTMAKDPLFKNIDCLQLYVPDLQRRIDFYCNNLGLKILWKTDSAVGLGMANDIAETVFPWLP